MRAVVYRETGKAAEVLRVEEVDLPEPGPGEVLVRVYASGINPTDYKARSGAVPRPIDDFQIPHQDGAGVVEAVGPGVIPGASASASGCFSPRPTAGGGPPPSGPWYPSGRPCRCRTGPRSTWGPRSACPL